MKKMITLPPFDNNSYVWQGKGWKKINIYSDRNHAIPNLESTEYLGNGNYRRYNNRGITIDYNVYSGIWNINGTSASEFQVIITNIEQNTDYNLSYYGISGTLTGGIFIIDISSPFVSILLQNNVNTTQTINNFTTTTQNQLRLNLTVNTTFTNYQFKLQLELGDTATPYVPPASPVKYYLEHDYEPLTMEGFVNYQNKMFNNFSEIIENKKEK